MYTIKLSDSTLLENLELNGNNFIAPSAVDDAVFEGNLDTVVIYGDGEANGTYTNMKLMSNIVRDGRSWIVLGEKSEQEIERERLEKKLAESEQLRADIDFLAIMTGVEL